MPPADVTSLFNEMFLRSSRVAGGRRGKNFAKWRDFRPARFMWPLKATLWCEIEVPGVWNDTLCASPKSRLPSAPFKTAERQMWRWKFSQFLRARRPAARRDPSVRETHLIASRSGCKLSPNNTGSILTAMNNKCGRFGNSNKTFSPWSISIFWSPQGAELRSGRAVQLWASSLRQLCSLIACWRSMCLECRESPRNAMLCLMPTPLVFSLTLW